MSALEISVITSMLGGLALFLFGMDTMSQGGAPLRNAPALKEMPVNFSNPIPGFGFALLFAMLIQFREEITRMSTRVNPRHIRRMHQNEESHELSALLVEAIYSEERVIDRCDIVSDALLRYGMKTGANVTSAPADVQEKRGKIERLFRDKYELLGLDVPFSE